MAIAKSPTGRRLNVEVEHQLTQVQAAIERHLRVPGTDSPLVPYPEQVAGARGLLRGSVIEMATGEGKTVTACFAAAISWCTATTRQRAVSFGNVTSSASTAARTSCGKTPRAPCSMAA